MSKKAEEENKRITEELLDGLISPVVSPSESCLEEHDLVVSPSKSCVEEHQPLELPQPHFTSPIPPEVADISIELSEARQSTPHSKPRDMSEVQATTHTVSVSVKYIESMQFYFIVHAMQVMSLLCYACTGEFL